MMGLLGKDSAHTQVVAVAAVLMERLLVAVLVAEARVLHILVVVITYLFLPLQEVMAMAAEGEVPTDKTHTTLLLVRVVLEE